MALLTLAMVTGTITLHVYSVLARFLIDEFGVSRTQIGLQVSTVSTVAALGSLPAGRAVDRLGGRRTISMVFALGAIAFGLVATASSYAALFAASAVAGCMNALVNPSTNKLLVEHVEPTRRGLAMGVKMSGVQLGVLGAGLVLPPVALAFGWRTAVGLVVGLSLVGAALTRLQLPIDVRRPVGTSAALARFRYPTATRYLAVYAFFMGAGMGAVVAFLPLYAEEGVGLSVTAAGVAAGLTGAVGVVARILWSVGNGSVTDLSRPLTLLGGLSACSVGFIWAAGPGRQAPLWAGVLLAGASVGSWNAVASLAAVGQVPSGDAGRATGLSFLGALGGLAVSPVLFGHVTDVSGSFSAGWAGVVVLFLVAALLGRSAGRPTGARGTRAERDADERDERTVVP